MTRERAAFIHLGLGVGSWLICGVVAMEDALWMAPL